MSITVPTAGNTAGRSANLAQTVEADTTWEAAAQLGQVAQQVGNAMEDDRLSRELSRAQVDMTRDLNTLRLQTEEIGDPDEFEKVWATGVQQLREAYIGADGGTGGRISIQNREAFADRFSSLQDNMAFQLGMRGVGLRQSQTTADLAAYQHEAGLAAAGLDAPGRAALIENGKAQIEAAVASGAMTPAEAQRHFLTLQDGIDATAAAALGDDPVAMLAALNAGELNGLGGEEVARLRQRAETDLAAAAANGTAENVKALNGYAIETVGSDPAGFLELAEAGLFANLPPETLSRHKVRARDALAEAGQDNTEARAMAALSSNPDQYLVRDEAGEWAGLTPQQAERNREAARTSIARRERELEEQEARAAEQRQREIGAQLGDVTDLVTASRGRAFAVDEAFLAAPDTRAHPDFARTMAALELHAEHGGLSSKTPSELRQMVATERAKPITQAYQAERLALLEQASRKASDGWGQSPIETARDLGVDVAPIDVTSDDLAEQLATRRSIGMQLQEQGFVDGAVLLDADEREDMLDATGPTADPAQRLKIARAAVAAGIPADQLSDDRVFRFATGSMRDGVSPAVMGRVLRGQAAVAEGNFTQPTPADIGPEFWTAFGSYFDGIDDGERRQQDVIQAATALYAGRGRKTGPGGEMDGGQFRQAIHEVLGGAGDLDPGLFSSGQATGGIQSIRSSMTLLPPSLSASAVERSLDRATAALRRLDGPHGGGRRAGAAGTDPDDLRAAAVNGDLPMVAGQPLSPRAMDAATIQAVGKDRYVLLVDLGRGPQVIGGEDGAAWQFSLRGLVGGAPQ